MTREADGRYCVSAVWLQERYQLERAMRLRLEHYDKIHMQDSTK